MRRTKNLQLISLNAYCPRAKVWEKGDIIKKEVQREDIINHPFTPIVIPKDMKYPAGKAMRPTGLYVFINSILP